jgi:hypothetical protein
MIKNLSVRTVPTPTRGPLLSDLGHPVASDGHSAQREPYALARGP